MSLTESMYTLVRSVYVYYRLHNNTESIEGGELNIIPPPPRPLLRYYSLARTQVFHQVKISSCAISK